MAFSTEIFSKRRKICACMKKALSIDELASTLRALGGSFYTACGEGNLQGTHGVTRISK